MDMITNQTVLLHSTIISSPEICLSIIHTSFQIYQVNATNKVSVKNCVDCTFVTKSELKIKPIVRPLISAPWQ
jgi:hypothetical protein